MQPDRFWPAVAHRVQVNALTITRKSSKKGVSGNTVCLPLPPNCVSVGLPGMTYRRPPKTKKKVLICQYH
jgi:hypothetical protein